MVETIFRVIIIILIISVILTVIAGVGITFSFPFQYGDLLVSFLHVVCYILPFNKLIPILVCVISVLVFKIIISILKTIWDIFPLRG